MTSHFAYTLMYEAALQAVDPSVAVPYWDFTLESKCSLMKGHQREDASVRASAPATHLLASSPAHPLACSPARLLTCSPARLIPLLTLSPIPHPGTFYSPNDWRNSPVFSNDWFGDASPPNG